MTSASDEMTFENATTMGLSREEWDLIMQRLGRVPNLCELGIFSAMWSEHCSYKSSKKWLKTQIENIPSSKQDYPFYLIHRDNETTFQGYTTCLDPKYGNLQIACRKIAKGASV